MYRQVKIQDMPQLIEMENYFFDVDSDLHDVKECCEKGTGFVYMIDENIKAYILYKECVKLSYFDSFTHIIQDMSCGYIVSLCVNENYQGKGIGKKLMGNVPLKGAVFLHVKKHNHNAIHLYEKLGFETVKQEKGFFRDDDALILLNKNYHLK